MNDGYEDGGQTADDFPLEVLAAIGRQVHWMLESGMGVAPATRDELAAGIEACAEDGLHLPVAVVYRWAREARYRVGVTLAKKKAASGWRAIDTAPKDGRKTWRRGHIRCSGLMRWQKRRWLVLNVSFGAQHESGWHPVKRDFTLKPHPHFQEDAPVVG